MRFPLISPSQAYMALAPMRISFMTFLLLENCEFKSEFGFDSSPWLQIECNAIQFSLI